MAMETEYAATEPARAEIDAMKGPVLLEFGAPWCGHCQAAQPLLEVAFAEHPEIQHIKIEDGKGRRLGRSFGVKLWPTLVFMKDGEETARQIRPTDSGEIERHMAKIASDM